MRISIFYLVFLCWLQTGTAFAEYVMVVDAGSTGSRLFIFKKENGKISLLPGGVFKDKKTGGIHKTMGSSSECTVGFDSCKNSVFKSQLRPYLEPLINFASKQIADPKNVPIYIRGTAGMRSLSHQARENLMRGLLNYFQKEGFAKASAQTIYGEEEGVYAWIAVNYLRGNLFRKHSQQTLGVLDMGGASTQAVFVPKDRQSRDVYQLKFEINGEDFSYPLYSFSNNELGMRKGMNSFAVVDCFNRGVETDRGLWQEVPEIDAVLANPTELNLFPSGDRDVCRRDIATRLFSHNLPEIGALAPAGTEFFAIGGFAELAKLFQMDNLSPSEIDSKGKQVCNTTWDQLKEEYSKRDKPKFLATGCFEMSYYSVLFSEGYGFKSESRISSGTKIDNQEVSIAYGIAIYEIFGGSLSQASD